MILPVKELKEALQAVAPAMNGKIVPITENVLIEVSDGRVKMTGTNLMLTIIKTFRCENQKSEEILINHKTLLDFIKQVNNTDVEILYDKKTYNSQVIAGKSKAKIEGEKVSDFPTINTDKGECKAVISHQEMLKIIRKALPFRAEHKDKPHVSGVLLKSEDGKSIAMATDTWRGVVMGVDLDAKSDFSVQLDENISLVRSIFPEEPIMIYVSGTNYHLAGSDVEIISRLVEGSFPDLLAVIPDKKDMIKVTLNKSEIQSELSRGKIFADKKTNAVKLSIQGDKIAILCRDVNYGREYEGQAGCETAGQDLDIALNIQYLLQQIDLMEEEQVEMWHCGDSKKAVAFSEDNYESIIMPLMLDMV